MSHDNMIRFAFLYTAVVLLLCGFAMGENSYEGSAR